MEGRFEDFTVGRQIDLDRVKEIYRLFKKHGFKLAGLRSHGRYLTDDDIARSQTLAEELRRDPERFAALQAAAEARLAELPASSKGVTHGGISPKGLTWLAAGATVAAGALYMARAARPEMTSMAFKNQQEFKKIFEHLFKLMSEHEQVGKALWEAKAPHRFDITDFGLQFNVTYASDKDAAKGKYLRWVWGACDWEPVIGMKMTSEVANRYFQGKENILLAVTFGRVKLSGPLTTLIKLAPATTPISTPSTARGSRRRATSISSYDARASTSGASGGRSPNGRRANADRAGRARQRRAKSDHGGPREPRDPDWQLPRPAAGVGRGSVQQVVGAAARDAALPRRPAAYARGQRPGRPHDQRHARFGEPAVEERRAADPRPARGPVARVAKQQRQLATVDHNVAVIKALVEKIAVDLGRAEDDDDA